MRYSFLMLVVISLAWSVGCVSIRPIEEGAVRTMVPMTYKVTVLDTNDAGDEHRSETALIVDVHTNMPADVEGQLEKCKEAINNACLVWLNEGILEIAEENGVEAVVVPYEAFEAHFVGNGFEYPEVLMRTQEREMALFKVFGRQEGPADYRQNIPVDRVLYAKMCLGAHASDDAWLLSVSLDYISGKKLALGYSSCMLDASQPEEKFKDDLLNFLRQEVICRDFLRSPCRPKEASQVLAVK